MATKRVRNIKEQATPIVQADLTLTTPSANEIALRDALNEVLGLLGELGLRETS